MYPCIIHLFVLQNKTKTEKYLFLQYLFPEKKKKIKVFWFCVQLENGQNKQLAGI